MCEKCSSVKNIYIWHMLPILALPHSTFYQISMMKLLLDIFRAPFSILITFLSKLWQMYRFKIKVPVTLTWKNRSFVNWWHWDSIQSKIAGDFYWINFSRNVWTIAVNNLISGNNRKFFPKMRESFKRVNGCQNHLSAYMMMWKSSLDDIYFFFIIRICSCTEKILFFSLKNITKKTEKSTKIYT